MTEYGGQASAQITVTIPRNRFAGPGHCQVEALIIDRLQQKVQSVYFEGADGKAVVCGYEDYMWKDIAADGLDYIEPTLTGHLHIEKYQIGRSAADCFNGFASVMTFGNDLACAGSFHASAYTATGQFLVVDNDHPHRHLGFSALPWLNDVVRKGISTDAIAPPFGDGLTEKCDLLP